MSTLFLVRHAQASFLADDYDELSDLGREQARQLGEYWARHGQRFDRSLVGPRRRHRQTAEIVHEVFSERGLDPPELSVMPELDEYPADQVLLALLPRLINENEELAALAEAARAAEDRRTRGRALDRMLQQALSIWAEATEAAATHESWSGFVGRVERAFASAQSGEGSGRQVVVWSSAGTIGAIVGRVLGASPSVMLELGWALHNASVSELTFSGNRVSLSRFNVLSHLSEPSSWTRR